MAPQCVAPIECVHIGRHTVTTHSWSQDCLLGTAPWTQQQSMRCCSMNEHVMTLKSSSHPRKKKEVKQTIPPYNKMCCVASSLLQVVHTMQCPNLSPGWEVYTCHQTKRDTAVRRATLREGKFRMWEKILPRVPTEGNQTVFELFFYFLFEKIEKKFSN